MHLENISLQSRNPSALMSFWARALNLRPGTVSDNLVEARLSVGDTWLDLCVERQEHPVPNDQPRVHFDLTPGCSQEATVERLLGFGARHLDIGQGQVPWVVLADPDGNPFCVLEERPKHASAGPIASLPLDSADAERDAAFWQAATGWVEVDGYAPVSLQHPSGQGLTLELCPEPRPKAPHGPQNLLHLDTRPDPGESQADCVARLLGLGGSRVEHDWGVLPWTVLRDPSGNELCVLDEQDASGQ